jgi:thioredoxin reductase (NADPH)
MKPILFVLDDERDDASRLGRDRAPLRCRLQGQDRRSATESMTRLRELNDDGAPVALILADQWMPEMTGTEFLVKAHEIHPDAGRLLVIDVGDVSAEGPIVRALTLNQLDFYFGKPWASPEQELYPVTGEALRIWALKNLPRYEKVKLVAPAASASAQRMRDLLEGNLVATGFYPLESEAGRDLMERYALSGDPPAIALTYPKAGLLTALLPLAPKATRSNDLGEARVWGPEEDRIVEISPRRRGNISCMGW